MFFLDETQEGFLNMLLMAIRPVFVGRRNCLSWTDERAKQSEMIKIHVGSDSHSAFISDVCMAHCAVLLGNRRFSFRPSEISYFCYVWKMMIF